MEKYHPDMELAPRDVVARPFLKRQLKQDMSVFT